MICIIPARGNSKRLPGKNIRALDGEPIINRVIKIAHDSGIFEMVMVSTDSQQIADIVQGAVIRRRVTHLSGDIPEDWVTTSLADDYSVGEFCRIYPFAALLTPERLNAGYRQFMTGSYDNVHECQKYTHPISRAIHLEDGYLTSEYVSKPTNYLSEFYHDAGTYMFTTLDALDRPLAKRIIKWMPVKEIEAQDIDDEDDWEMLEAKYYRRKM